MIFRQYAALTDKVADHYEATATAVECTEQCFLDPFCQTLYTVGIEHEFVIVQIVDNDIVGAVAAVTQTARRLPTSACEKGAAVAGYERTLLPRSSFFCAPKSAIYRWLNSNSACMSPNSVFAISCDLLTSTITFNSRTSCALSHKGMNTSKWVLLACPRAHSATYFRVAGSTYRVGGFDMKRCAIRMLACFLVVGVVREIVIYERRIIR